MPDVLTKYPEVLIQELKDAKGKCGEGVPQQILKDCPADRFCLLPTGEICVYDLKNIHSMTQVSSSDWLEAVKGIPGIFSPSNLSLLIFCFGIGVILGLYLKK
jgi:hypothetical protein